MDFDRFFERVIVRLCGRVGLLGFRPQIAASDVPFLFLSPRDALAGPRRFRTQSLGAARGGKARRDDRLDPRGGAAGALDQPREKMRHAAISSR